MKEKFNRVMISVLIIRAKVFVALMITRNEIVRLVPMKGHYFFGASNL